MMNFRSTSASASVSPIADSNEAVSFVSFGLVATLLSTAAVFCFKVDAVSIASVAHGISSILPG